MLLAGILESFTKKAESGEGQTGSFVSLYRHPPLSFNLRTTAGISRVHPSLLVSILLQ